MESLRKYALITDGQMASFRKRFGPVVAARIGVYAQWLRGLPLMEWVDYSRNVAAADIEAVVGLLCVCHRERLVRFTFSEDFRRIRRDPETEDELTAIFGGNI
jgi:hypothetical protein